VSGAHSASTPRPPLDVAAAVRRGQRRLVLRLAATWVLVLAVTAGLVVGAGVAINGSPVPPVLAAAPPVDSTVVLSWTSHDPRAVGFVVLRDGTEVGRTTGRTFEDREAPPGQHSYRVRALDADGHRLATSNTVTVTVPVPCAVPAPTSVTAVYDNANGVVRVSWQQPAERPGLRFVIYRNQAEVTRTDTLAFNDRAAAPGSMHKYTVRAITGECRSELSSPASVMVSPLTPPTDLRAGASDKAVDLRWVSTDPRAHAYLVVRDGAQLAATEDTQWADEKVKPGATYRYTVRTRDAAGHLSTDSQLVTVTVPQPLPDLRVRVLIPAMRDTPTSGRVEVVNEGSARSVLVAIEISGIDRQRVPALQPGESRVIVAWQSCRDPTAPTVTPVVATVDPDDVVPEPDESNNSAQAANPCG
jgi:hypothetical protein